MITASCALSDPPRPLCSDRSKAHLALVVDLIDVDGRFGYPERIGMRSGEGVRRLEEEDGLLRDLGSRFFGVLPVVEAFA